MPGSDRLAATPGGRVPAVSVTAGTGTPAAETVNNAPWPTVRVVASALVNAGAVPFTVTVKVPVPNVLLAMLTTSHVTVVVPMGKTSPDATGPEVSLQAPSCSPVSLCGAGQETLAPAELVAFAVTSDGTRLVPVKIVPVRVAPVKSVRLLPVPNCPPVKSLPVRLAPAKVAPPHAPYVRLAPVMWGW